MVVELLTPLLPSALFEQLHLTSRRSRASARLVAATRTADLPREIVMMTTAAAAAAVAEEPGP